MKTVLVVEDNDDLRDLFVAVLKSEGYDVREAEHGKRALEVLAELKGEPCLVLLDIMMPVMDGFEFMNIVREEYAAHPPTIVVMSAAKVGSETPGVRRVLQKPLSAGQLSQVVREVCGAPEATA